MKAKLNVVAHQFLTHRQIGECEAYFRIFPHLHMKESNIEAIFVQTGFKQNRSRFLHKLSDDELKLCHDPIVVSGKPGFYAEKPSTLDKYMRRDFTEHSEIYNITYIQFSKRYTPARSPPKDNMLFKPEDYVCDSLGFSKYSAHDFIVTHDFKIKKNLKILFNTNVK